MTLRLILAVDLREDNVIFKAAVVENEKSSGTGVVLSFQGNDFCLCPLRKKLRADWWPRHYLWTISWATSIFDGHENLGG